MISFGTVLSVCATDLFPEDTFAVRWRTVRIPFRARARGVAALIQKKNPSLSCQPALICIQNSIISISSNEKMLIEISYRGFARFPVRRICVHFQKLLICILDLLHIFPFPNSRHAIYLRLS